METYLYCECGLMNGLHTTRLFTLVPSSEEQGKVHTWIATCTNCGKQHEEGGFLEEWHEEMAKHQ